LFYWSEKGLKKKKTKAVYTKILTPPSKIKTLLTQPASLEIALYAPNPFWVQGRTFANDIQHFVLEALRKSRVTT
jgi:hypothetical protein